MLEESLKRYKIYEYIRDNEKITSQMSNTKKLIVKLMQNDEKTTKYCYRKMLEEKAEIQDAMIGKHYHKNMTKREILVNEISQYIYWITIIAISKKVTYKEFNEEAKINKIIKHIDLTKIEEKNPITIKEIIAHDLDQMAQKQYLKEVV